MKDHKQNLMTKMQLDEYSENIKPHDYFELYSFMLNVIKFLSLVALFAIVYYCMNSIGPAN